jgi:cytochrome c peroxidase
MGLSHDEAVVMRRFETNARYAEMFAAAFPSESAPATLANIVKAIASFERTLISLDSSYDRFVAGDAAAMSGSAQRGLRLFRSDRMKCSRCHDGFNFRMTDEHRNGAEHVAYHNIGLYAVLTAPGMTVSNPSELTPSLDAGRFKAPTLRNVSVTAPYMHDGSVATLSDVIDIYAAGGRVISTGPSAGDGRRNPYKSPFVSGFTITPEEKRDLLAFLDSLTDRSFLTNPELGNPFASTH